MSLQRKIYDLYILDRHVRGMQTRLHSSTHSYQVHQTRLNQLSTQRTELAEQLRQTQAHASSLEHQARDMGERVDKLRQQMLQVKSNKEYSALLVEVNTFKLERGKIEDEALTQMTQVDEIKASLEQLDAQRAEQEKLLAAAAREVEARRAEVGKELQELTEKRDAAAKEVPPDVRNLFNRLVQQHEGEAMAPVQEEDARRMEYICSGCYMQLPIEVVNTLLTQAEKIGCCPSCGRILYVEDELKEKMGGRVKART
jgi:predicted  nucleic acid-binding Zn-ribbon protein